MTLDCSSIEAFTCTTASTDGLIIAEFIGAEDEIVHGALATGYIIKGFQDEIDQSLGSLDVSSDNCR